MWHRVGVSTFPALCLPPRGCLALDWVIDHARCDRVARLILVDSLCCHSGGGDVDQQQFYPFVEVAPFPWAVDSYNCVQAVPSFLSYILQHIRLLSLSQLPMTTSVFTKSLPASVRDAVILSLRRTPPCPSNGHGGDSLRRLVLQRNALGSVMDVQDTGSTRHMSLRKFSAEMSPYASDTRTKQGSVRHAHPPLRKSRSAQDLAVLSVVGDPLASSTHEELLEDMWFDRVMEDLSLDDSASHHQPGL